MLRPRPLAAVQRDLEDLRAIASPVAVGTTQIHVREELHLHVLEAVAAAGRTAAGARIEAERPDRVTALPCERLAGEQLADCIEGADIARGIGARRAANRRLIDHHDAGELLGAFERIVRARRFRRLAKTLEQRRMQDILNQRRFARSGHPGDAHEAVQRNRDVDSLEIVFACAANAERCSAGGRL